MALTLKKCKVCGREYKYCRTAKLASTPFRWQDVACSPEHGSIYFDRIMESRKQICITDTKNDVDDDFNLAEDEDPLFEEEFDDDEDVEFELEK